jgi:hypothetical protein
MAIRVRKSTILCLALYRHVAALLSYTAMTTAVSLPLVS